MSMDNGEGGKPQEAEGTKGGTEVDVDALKAQIKAEYDEKLSKLQKVIDEKVQGKKELEAQILSEAEKRGEYEKALEIHKQHLLEKETMLSELQGKVSELESLRAKAELADKIEAQRRDELLARFPEEARELYKDDSLESIEKAATVFLKDQGKVKVPSNGSAPPGKGELDPKKLTIGEYFKRVAGG